MLFHANNNRIRQIFYPQVFYLYIEHSFQTVLNYISLLTQVLHFLEYHICNYLFVFFPLEKNKTSTLFLT